MTENNWNRPALRFDHREIVVIFSLFIFVSLLMFTVGILVGKGLAQAKYEGAVFSGMEKPKVAVAAPGEPPATSSSVSEGETSSASQKETLLAKDGSEGLGSEPALSLEDTNEKPPLKLIPEHPHVGELTGSTLQEPQLDGSAADVLKNPKIRALLEKETGKAATRTTASIPKSTSTTAPTSFAQGKFTVQIGSYPTKDDAESRVVALKKLGFPHAYSSAKEIGGKKDTWYRVWLGYFPDSPSAERSGRLLQERGEVKNYLVRKTDNSD